MADVVYDQIGRDWPVEVLPHDSMHELVMTPLLIVVPYHLRVAI
jgi:hypothetical protein